MLDLHERVEITLHQHEVYATVTRLPYHLYIATKEVAKYSGYQFLSLSWCNDINYIWIMN